MTELSVFVDESGDPGHYEPHAPYYIIALLFHDQGVDISEQIGHLRRHLAEQGFDETYRDPRNLPAPPRKDATPGSAA